MKIARWTQVVGIGWKPRRWERPLLLFAAFCAADLVWLLIAPRVTSGVGGESPTLEFFNFADPWFWLDVVLANLVLAFLATLVFGLVRNVLAIPVVALARTDSQPTAA